MSKNLLKFITKIIDSIEPLAKTDDLDRFDIIKHIHKYFVIAIMSGRLYFWTGNHFQALSDVHQEQSFFLKKIIEKLTGGKIPVSMKFISSVYIELLNEYFIPEETEGYLALINVQNGLLGISKDDIELYEADPSLGYRYVLSYEYIPEAKAPIFEKFLAETVQDENSIKVIYEYMGYILLGKHLSLEAALLLLGDGRNGKSVLIKTLMKFVGEDNTSNVELQELSNPNRTVTMDGKLLNVGSDSSDKNFDSSQFKRAISNEPITGRRLYHDAYVIKDLPKFVFAMNNLPLSQGDTSFGLLRRLKIIKFDKIIAEHEIDRYLDKKIEKELSGILNLAIEGLRRLIKQGGFTESDAINKAVKSYEDEINMVKRFIEDVSIAHSEKGYMSNQQLYETFVEWCKDEGIKVPSKSFLLKKLRSSGFAPYKNNAVKGFRVTVTKMTLSPKDESRYAGKRLRSKRVFNRS
ncbi:phage/plasmid primase, P4 family [Sulfuricurvum kujiense DSM 16994]|uniref:Phage/plasmid primase, P4 family n=1 Tax=Sulfuricurvum kujiense (strain ATCC BAA-921 / DSM 16994 / JCM 11577 / YK-1) TaxID=709032 RepID=E4TYE0_SULKY|nr:DNA primase family protein [Sulfuricurvum kujiense]ADR35085.1 phage/plasmid primase, P4 family [Sulfuricurvum kujiense DSM 16994]